MIYGDGVRLRRIERDDLERFVLWINDPEVRAGVSLFLAMSSDEELTWYEAVLERDARERPFSLDVRQGEAWEHVGSCGLFGFDDRTRKAELGIMVGDKAYWGQGVGKAAMNALLRLGFQELNLNRIFLRVFEFNGRALGLYRTLGFKEEGQLRSDCFHEGEYWDTILMGMLREEWEGRSSDAN